MQLTLMKNRFWSARQAQCAVGHRQQLTVCTAFAPGAEGVGSVHKFWNQAVQAVDLPQQIPHERWDIDRFYSPDVSVGKMYVRHAGFIDSFDQFDAAAFR